MIPYPSALFYTRFLPNQFADTHDSDHDTRREQQDGKYKLQAVSEKIGGGAAPYMN